MALVNNNPLVGLVSRGATQLWWGTIQFASANVSGVAALLGTALQLGSVVTTAALGVVAVVGSLCGVVVTVGQGVARTFGKLWDVVAAAWIDVLGYASGLTQAALIAVAIDRPLTAENIGVTNRDWLLLDDANNAKTALETWCTHPWPNAREQFTEGDVQIFLRAARVMAVASALSYADEGQAARTLQSRLWSTVEISMDQAQAMLFKASTDQPVMIVAFRGTQLPFDEIDHTFWKGWIRGWQFVPDWVRNFDAKLVPYHQGDINGLKVHQGFWKGWEVLRGPLREQIEAYSRERGGAVVQLYVTGHSQGAALAGVSLLDLLLDQQTQRQQPQVYTVKGCLTIATPKHCDAAYTNAVRAAAIVNNRNIPFDLLANQDAVGYDPVACLPPRGVEPRYSAPAGRLWVVRVGRKTTGPANEAETNQVMHATFGAELRHVILNIPLHFIGTRVGYLHAMKD